ncbi:PASTA domain-containing protein [Paenibacillus sp. OAS669]|uniref:PASTA domain-containing protein n=1 Tax=Paenibacillus sp. OAS669 TaxID=2663821 RepID=UPI00178999D3|nr:PASTA domain-containing protein [Paenibacillus sp. OAS669]MBE1442497.1 serine/threonine-protein kinase [Paenibacillus sp. OAS669]
MEDRMEQRYVPEQPILPLEGGMVYMGKDLSLNRKVILYSLDIPDEEFVRTYTQMIGEASQFTDRAFIHILDTGYSRAAKRLTAVLKPCNGTLLITEIDKKTLAFAEMISIVHKLALGMQKALEEGIVGFSVRPDNIWLDSERYPVIMNYWEQGKDNERGTFGLSSLLLQMLTGSSTAQLHLEDASVQEALRAVPSEQRSVLVPLIQQAMTEDVSLKLFITQLARIVIMRSSQSAASTAEPDTRKRPVSTIMKSPADEIPAPKKAAQYDEPVRKATRIVEEDDDEEEEEETRKLTVGSVMKKLLFIGGAIVVIGICSVLILMGLLEALKPDKGYSPPSSNAVSETTPTPTPEPKATPKPDAPKETKQPDSGSVKTPGSPTKVPNFIGMTESEAHQAALAAGLRYKFSLENNDMEKGKIFKQDPQPNADAKAGDSVVFSISKGP